MQPQWGVAFSFLPLHCISQAKSKRNIHFAFTVADCFVWLYNHCHYHIIKTFLKLFRLPAVHMVWETPYHYHAGATLQWIFPEWKQRTWSIFAPTREDNSFLQPDWVTSGPVPPWATCIPGPNWGGVGGSWLAWLSQSALGWVSLPWVWW